ncbi:DNA-directed DNA polymerase eta rad30 [Geranomyces variabilis]|uniref:DNA polymerase eta n=1 Tax=Geranomyces variabilis TaxID=109894 RepID=A0AAD5TU10_9FUNG|nr:DNA-directed DNA polymerase eta rad30 [Geranomyces variabilis]
MDEALKRTDRVIVHVDLDAFYCQVEHVRLGIPTDVPLCVQQWQGLIAVNYAARAAGIKRHCNVTEARKLCPEARFVHVATFADGDTTPQYHSEGISYQTHKVSLDPYRKASMKIMAIFERSCPKYQRASIDEAYLDLTDEVNMRIKTRLASSSSTDMDDDAEPDVNWDGAGILVGDQVSHSTGWRDLQLRVAAEISQEIRATVYKELQYTCSAGIAHNKTLAKLCSGLNKPNKQTVLRQAAVSPFMEKLPLGEIRNLGGKRGTEVEEALGVTTAGELWKYSVETLQAKFGASTGSWLYDICRGICHEPVTETAIAKSMMAAKTLRPHIKTVAELSHWLEILSNELYNRLIDDNALNNRWPRVITFHVKHPLDASSHSRRTDLPPFHDFVATSIRDRCLALWTSGGDGSASRWPIERIAVGVGGFEKLDAGVVSVKNFFKKVEPTDEPGVVKTPTPTPAPGAESSPPSRRKPPAKATNSLQNFFNAAPAPAPSNTGATTTNPSPQKHRPPSSSSSGGPLDAFFQTTTTTTSATPSSPTPQKSEQPASAPGPNPASSDSPFQCATCPPGSAAFTDARELAEHNDWHMAMALHNEERGGGGAAAAPPSSSSSLSSSTAARGGKTKTGPARGKRKRATTAGDARSRKAQPPLAFGRRE